MGARACASLRVYLCGQGRWGDTREWHCVGRLNIHNNKNGPDGWPRLPGMAYTYRIAMALAGGTKLPAST